MDGCYGARLADFQVTSGKVDLTAFSAPPADLAERLEVKTGC
jgi:hypothetical protein